MMTPLYSLLTRALHPLIPLYLSRRAQRGKEDTTRMGERLGRASLPRPLGRVLWFHAASMGETLSILPLIERLVAEDPHLHILLTTVTVTSAELAAKRLPPRAVHQFAPVDTPQAVRRFLHHWQPDMALWVESELWPNMLTMTHQTGCTMMLLNARLSARSARRWRHLPHLARHLLGVFTLILAQSEEDAVRFRSLRATQTKSCGNLKFAAPALKAEDATLHALQAQIGTRPLWLASSTHPGEEAIAAEVHRHLKPRVPGLLTMIVPRHSRRGDELAAELRASGLHVAQRSKGEALTPETELYLADTMGELGIFYRLARIVFVGGSLVSHGGQNPLEPARLGCAVLYGPHMENFRESCALLEHAHATIRVTSAAMLATEIEALMHDAPRTEKLAQAAQHAAAQTEDVLDRVLAELRPYLEALP